jgi:S-adenosylmethionine synthetase
MHLIVEALASTPVAHRRVEIVERKGIGHPDTMCDAAVEAVSLALNRMYLAELGAIPHYNIDKAFLIAGQCEKDFGGGRITQPMTFIIGDRATSVVGQRALPVADVVQSAVRGWVRAHLPHVDADAHVRTMVALAAGSEELRGVLADPRAVVANDTSGVSGYAPLSPTEELALAVEQFLTSRAFKDAFPDTGQDVKIFVVRRDDRVEVTVAMPLLCRLIAAEEAYFLRKQAVVAALQSRFASAPFHIEWYFNTLDRHGRGAAGTYLTLTGTSAEDADSGQVGRGNRVNGLIAFARPTGGEAAAGKNPLAHPGKIYNVLSHRLARLIHQRHPAIIEVYVNLVSRIGAPLDQPWTGVQLVLPSGMAIGDVERDIDAVVRAELARLPEFCGELVRGEHAVY